jgi:hypothetical protein
VNFPFDPTKGLLIVNAELFGLSGSVVLRLALDTGATATMVNVGPLVAVSYDPSLAPHRVQVTTGSGVEFVPKLVVTRLEALGQARTLFPVLSHTLPPSAGIDGVLGLDFLRGQKLTIDFRIGEVSLD